MFKSCPSNAIIQHHLLTLEDSISLKVLKYCEENKRKKTKPFFVVLMNQMKITDIGSLTATVTLLLPSHLTDLFSSSTFAVHSFSLVVSGECTCKSASNYLLPSCTDVKIKGLLSTIQKLVLDWWAKF